MDTLQMLSELRAEHREIEEAILALQRVATGGGGKRRGRPPEWARAAQQSDSTIAVVPKRTRKAVSAATRKRMAEAQRKRWAARKA